MVSKNEKSPDDSEKSDNNVRIDEEEDILAGNSYLLQVPVKKVPYDSTLNTSIIDSLQADNNKDTDNIIQEVSEDETAVNENEVDETTKNESIGNETAENQSTENESTENGNTHLPDMKIKIENRKTKPVLETVQFKSFSPEIEAEENSGNELIPEALLFVDEQESKKIISLEGDVVPEPAPTVSTEVTLEPKPEVSTEATPEKKVELIIETENKGIFPPPTGSHSEGSTDHKGGEGKLKTSQKTKEEKKARTSGKAKKAPQKAKVKKKSGFAGNMRDLTRDIVGIKEGEKLSDKLKEFFEEVKTSEGAKKKSLQK